MFRSQLVEFVFIHFVEVLVDLTDSAPPEKKIWPETMDAVDAAPPAEEKGKGKGKEPEKKKIDVSSEFNVQGNVVKSS